MVSFALLGLWILLVLVELFVVAGGFVVLVI